MDFELSDKAKLGEVAGDDDIAMVSPIFESYQSSKQEKRQNGCNGCQCCMLMIVALIAFLALCAGVAAIILIVVFPNITSPINSQVQAVESLAEKLSMQLGMQNNTLGTLITELGDQIETLQMELQAQKMELSAVGDFRSSAQQQLDTLVETQNTLVETQSALVETQNNQFDALMTAVSQIGPGGSANPISSCRDLVQGSPSGVYWIHNSDTSLSSQVYCHMNRTNCGCSSTTQGWMRVANVDMTDPNQNCPDGLTLVSRTSAPLRTCGRAGPIGCVSTTFSTYGVQYSRVCGKILGYQDSTPDGFVSGQNIEQIYVDGVSLTYGQSPRQHIWTFVGTPSDALHRCPCVFPDIPFTGVPVPSFVGDDYFCDAAPETHSGNFFADDPLWDGQGCGSSNGCCEFNNPPWFCKQLPQPTTENIELRICGSEDTGNEDTPVEKVELYVR